MVRRPKHEAEATRQSILDAAQWCFRTYGLSGTSMSLIATRAHCSRGAIYWHFREQADILEAVLDRGRPHILDRFKRLQAPRSALLDGLRACLRQLLKDVEADDMVRTTLEIVVHNCDFRAGEERKILASWREEQIALRALLCGVLERAQLQGEVKEGVCCYTLASLMIFAMLGAMKFDLIHWGRITPLHSAAPALDAILDGISVRPPTEGDMPTAS